MAQEERNQWEYEVVSAAATSGDVNTLKTAFNTHGGEGWEIVAVFPQPGSTTNVLVVAKRHR